MRVLYGCIGFNKGFIGLCRVQGFGFGFRVSFWGVSLHSNSTSEDCKFESCSTVRANSAVLSFMSVYNTVASCIESREAGAGKP